MSRPSTSPTNFPGSGRRREHVEVAMPADAIMGGTITRARALRG